LLGASSFRRLTTTNPVFGSLTDKSSGRKATANCFGFEPLRKATYGARNVPWGHRMASASGYLSGGVMDAGVCFNALLS